MCLQKFIEIDNWACGTTKFKKMLGLRKQFYKSIIIIFKHFHTFLPKTIPMI